MVFALTHAGADLMTGKVVMQGLSFASPFSIPLALGDLSLHATARPGGPGWMSCRSRRVIAAVIPGSTSAALVAMEAHMCYQIGKIYRGDNYTNRTKARFFPSRRASSAGTF